MIVMTTLTKEDILREVEERTELGQDILEMEIEYYLDLFR